MNCATFQNISFRASSRRIRWPVARPACQGRVRALVRASTDEQQKEVPLLTANNSQPSSTAYPSSSSKYKWTFDGKSGSSRGDGRLVIDLPVAAIRRPLGRTRANDPEKVAALMESIKDIGLQEPIDVLEVDGVYYGFSGCHRFEAHQRLGAETIRCRVRKATKEVLRMHLM